MAEIRPYDRDRDFDRVARMLVDTFGVSFPPVNWPRMRWEYMHYHPNILDLDTRRIGVVDAGGDVAAVVHFEHAYGALYLQVRPGHDHVKPELVSYAQATFSDASRRRPGWNVVGLYVNDFDLGLASLLEERGFVRMPDAFSETMARADVSRLAPAPLPAGYRLASLADENDLGKVNRVLWRGFEHEGPPPEDEIEGRRLLQRAPHFRKDLTIVAVAPDGTYASYAGLWTEHENGHCLVEPVATDPDHRRRGLGRAVVVEGLRRAAREDISWGWVGSDLPFYRSVGFERVFQAHFWARYTPQDRHEAG